MSFDFIQYNNSPSISNSHSLNFGKLIKSPSFTFSDFKCLFPYFKIPLLGIVFLPNSSEDKGFTKHLSKKELLEPLLNKKI